MSNKHPLIGRMLCLDDDHAIGAPDAIVREAGGILEDFDRGNVIRIDSDERPTRPGLDRETVNHVQGLRVGR